MNGETKSKLRNLGPSNYRVTVTDNNNCTATVNTDIIEPKALEFDVVTTEDVTCPHYSDGYINLQAKGGTTTNEKQYEFSIDGGQNFVSGGKFPGLKAGDYSVVLRDNNGCVAPRKVTVGTPEELFIVATKDRSDSLKMGESTILGFTKSTQSGVIPAISKMNWSEETGLSCSDCESPNASPYASALYTIEARYHKNCIAKSAIKVNVKDPLDFFIPNAFTPGNGDGINDVLYVYGNGIKKLRLMIFNRWGEKVFESDHLSKGWDGIYKGELQQSGVYSYSAEVEYLNGDKKNKKGSITLIK
jgi:gliding motility-associated-like protein